MENVRICQNNLCYFKKHHYYNNRNLINVLLYIGSSCSCSENKIPSFHNLKLNTIFEKITRLIPNAWIIQTLHYDSSCSFVKSSIQTHLSPFTSLSRTCNVKIRETMLTLSCEITDTYSNQSHNNSLFQKLSSDHNF